MNLTHRKSPFPLQWLWEPFEWLSQIESLWWALDDFQSEAQSEFSSEFHSKLYADYPSAIHETDTAYQVRLQVPDWDPKDITAEVIDQVLIIQGYALQRNQTQAQDGAYQFQHCQSRQFTKHFQLPQNADLSQIEASHEADTLVFSIPKRVLAQNTSIAIEVKP